MSNHIMIETIKQTTHVTLRCTITKILNMKHVTLKLFKHTNASFLDKLHEEEE